MKQMKSFEALGKELLGVETFTAFVIELINGNGQKGFKILRLEDSKGKSIEVKEFLKQFHIDPRSNGVDFIGNRGYPISGKVKVVKIKAKRKEQEQPQIDQK
ncbi:MAG: hypothetical protein F9Y92_05725 [Thermoplasmatales archaeon]|nr:hypothetical protein [Thermoplasmatales archaeon]